MLHHQRTALGMHEVQYMKRQMERNLDLAVLLQIMRRGFIHLITQVHNIKEQEDITSQHVSIILFIADSYLTN